MKTLQYLSIFIFTISIFSCEPRVVESGEYEGSIPTPITNGYDEALAKKLGADEYGMHKYVIAFLKKGPNTDQSEEEAKALQKAHMDNIGKLADKGKLVLAGPFLDNGDLRGIYIFDVETIEEAEALTATDPAIKAGRLEMELHPWYGSAAVMQINEVHDKITKTHF